MNNLLSFLHPSDQENVSSLLDRIIPFIKTDQVAIVGGLAIDYQLSKYDKDYDNSFRELDLITKQRDSLSANIQKNFYVYHYHPSDDKHFYMALVDHKENSQGKHFKIDIFRWKPSESDDMFEKVGYKDQTVWVSGIERQFAHAVADIYRIREINPENKNREPKIGYKYFEHAEILDQLVREKGNIAIADSIWRKYSHANSITEAFEEAKKLKAVHPEYLEENPFEKFETKECKECKEANGFTLRDKQKVHDLLKTTS